MIAKQKKNTEMLSIYYLKSVPSQNMQVQERSLALIAPNTIFERYINYAIEGKKAASLAEKKAKHISKNNVKYEMPKQWEDKLKAIHEKQEERRTSKEKREEEERNKFVKEMNEKKERERIKVIEQARRLFLYKQPHCRLINGALLTSECIRELNAQREFELYLKDLENKKEEDFKKEIQNEVRNYEHEMEKKIEEKLSEKRRYKEQLINQIDEIERNNESLLQFQKATEQEDLKNMVKELELIEDAEKKKKEDTKVRLKRMFTEAIENKTRYNKQQKMNEEAQDKARQIYAESKQKIQKMLQSKQEQERRDYLQRIESLAKIVAALRQSFDPEEEERKNNEIMKEKEVFEQNKLKMERDKKYKMRLDIEHFRQQNLEAREKRLKEEQNLKSWETLQRIKKNKFDKDVQIYNDNKEAQRKKKYAEELRKQMLEKAWLEFKNKQVLNDTSETKEVLNVSNQRILEYCNEVIKESTGVRPLFPIIKAAEQVKKEIGIIPVKKYEKSEISPVIKKKRKKRPVFVKDVQKCHICYFG